MLGKINKYEPLFRNYFGVKFSEESGFLSWQVKTITKSPIYFNQESENCLQIVFTEYGSDGDIVFINKCKSFNNLPKEKRTILFYDLNKAGTPMSGEIYTNVKVQSIKFDTCSYMTANNEKEVVIVFNYEDVYEADDIGAKDDSNLR